MSEHRDGAQTVVPVYTWVNRVLSVAMRGNDDRRSMALAKQLIEARLKKDQWEVSGNWRVMGYNSPMVPSNRRVWELQLPVKPRPDTMAHIDPGSPVSR